MRIELIATDRQSVMLAITPPNRLQPVRDSNSYHHNENVKSSTLRRTGQLCMGDRTRTCSLFIPGEGSDQSEYSHILKEFFFKSVPVASHGERLFLLLHLIPSIHVIASCETDHFIYIACYMEHRQFFYHCLSPIVLIFCI